MNKGCGACLGSCDARQTASRWLDVLLAANAHRVVCPHTTRAEMCVSYLTCMRQIVSRFGMRLVATAAVVPSRLWLRRGVVGDTHRYGTAREQITRRTTHSDSTFAASKQSVRQQTFDCCTAQGCLEPSYRRSSRSATKVDPRLIIIRA
jgi:hypothetical protein